LELTEKLLHHTRVRNLKKKKSVQVWEKKTAFPAWCNVQAGHTVPGMLMRSAIKQMQYKLDKLRNCPAHYFLLE
jgi:hypothetical protein